jgi:hypothetical protein
VDQKIKNYYEYDIHNIVGLRVVNPSAADLKLISNNYGAYEKELDREPDITIKFISSLETPDLVFIGLDNAGFNKDGYYILSSGRSSLKVKIPFEKIGQPLEIICQTGIPGIPLLNHIINLSFLSKNYIPLHASAFRYNNLNALVMGWSKGGKTESLLAFANNDAEYIGDEVVMLSENGNEMFGIPASVTVWEWQYKQVPKLIPELSKNKKALFSLIHLIESIYNFLRKTFLKNSFVTKVISDALPAFKRQLNFRVAPKYIFKEKIYNQKASTDKIILIMSHNSDQIIVKSCPIDEVISRMINSHDYENSAFIQHYVSFKFAFPDLRNPFLEDLNKLQADLLKKALSGKEAYKVLHPYPVSFDSLFNSMSPIFNNIRID